MGLHDQIRIERVLVVEHVLRRCQQVAAVRAAAGAPAHGALALAADLQRAHQLHLGERPDQLAGQRAPGPPRGGGVDDDDQAAVGEELGHIDEGAVGDVVVALGDVLGAEHHRAQRVPVEPRDRDAVGLERLGQPRGERRLAAARQPREPDNGAAAGRPATRRRAFQRERERGDPVSGQVRRHRRRVDDELSR